MSPDVRPARLSSSRPEQMQPSTPRRTAFPRRIGATSRAASPAWASARARPSSPEASFASASRANGSPLPESGLDQPASNRVARELHTVAHAELLEDVLAVAVDRLDADEELVGDLLRRVRLG